MKPHGPDRDLDPALGALLESAYAETVDVDLAARHLWVIHRAAGAMRSQGRRTRKALVSVLAGGMFFMSSGGALAASSNALPGDMLYGVKRGVETARIVLTVSKEGDARLYLALAERRMAEASRMVDKRPEAVPKLVQEALDSLNTAERTGGTQVAMEVQAARRETTQQLDVLVAVLDQEAAQLIDTRKVVDEQTELAMVPTLPAETPSESAVESPSASPSEDTSTVASESTASATPSTSTTTSPTAGETASTTPTPTATSTASPSASPSATPTATKSPSASESATPTEPTPSSSPGRKYESVEPSEAPSGTATATATPTPAETPTS